MQDGSNFNLISEIADEDVNRLVKAQESYGDSWRSRGGGGAFLMLARKGGRVEKQVTKEGYDIFKTINNDPSSTGILDDIRDLRRYLLLVEGYVTDNWREEHNND